MNELEKAKVVLKEAYEGIDDLLFLSNVTGKAEMTYSIIKDGYKVEINIMSKENEE